MINRSSVHGCFGTLAHPGCFSLQNKITFTFRKVDFIGSCLMILEVIYQCLCHYTCTVLQNSTSNFVHISNISKWFFIVKSTWFSRLQYSEVQSCKSQRQPTVLSCLLYPFCCRVCFLRMDLLIVYRDQTSSTGLGRKIAERTSRNLADMVQ